MATATLVLRDDDVREKLARLEAQTVGWPTERRAAFVAEWQRLVAAGAEPIDDLRVEGDAIRYRLGDDFVALCRAHGLEL